MRTSEKGALRGWYKKGWNEGGTTSVLFEGVQGGLKSRETGKRKTKKNKRERYLDSVLKVGQGGYSGPSTNRKTPQPPIKAFKFITRLERKIIERPT